MLERKREPSPVDFIFKERRIKFQKQMPPGSVAILFSNPAAVRSADVEHPYRQNSDLYYLSGFREEDSILVITNEETILYLRPRDPEKETWNGFRLGVERAAETLHVDRAADIAHFSTELPGLLRNREALFYAYGKNEKRDRMLFSAADTLIHRGRSGDFGPTRIIHPGTILHEMRLFKSAYELEKLREAADISVKAHMLAMQKTRPGYYEYEVEAIYLSEFRRRNAREAYPSIVASGNNACILHYIENDQFIREQDLILVDAGAEKDFMSADITITFPAAREFSPAHRYLYQIVLDAHNRSIFECRPGTTMDQIHDIATRTLVRGLIDMGLLAGSVDENMESGKYRDFYMHRTGHWLGTDVHDVGSYYAGGKARSLEPGMVFTVEPGLYVPDRPGIPDEMRGTGIRIEDDILILRDGYENLTEAVPRDVEKLEEIRRAALD